MTTKSPATTMIDPILRSAPIATSWKGEIDYTLSDTGLLTRMESCPVRKVHDIRLHFMADGWSEIYPFNFRFTRDWKDPGVQMELEPTIKLEHSFGTSYEVSNGVLALNFQLPAEMVRYLEACEPALGSDGYLAVKFDVLARNDTGWYLADPRLGVRR